MDSFSTYNYTTLLAATQIGPPVPVGVIIWSSDGGIFRYRVPARGERVRGVEMRDIDFHLQITLRQITAWRDRGHLPYMTVEASRFSEAWWNQVRRLLDFRIKLGAVLPIDCQDPSEELDPLYEAVVKPEVQRNIHEERVDAAVKRALGVAAARFRRRDVIGFGGRPITLQRCASDSSRVVSVEAVNLAATTAEHDADALSGKLMRIKDGEDAKSRAFTFILGYLTSPGGLNGEAALVHHITYKTGERMYDLRTQRDDFQKASESAIAGLELELTAPRQ